MTNRRSRLKAPERCFPLAFAVISLLPGVSAAQARATLVGVVRDTAGAPIVDADVGIPALRVLTRSDASGAFTVARVPPGLTSVTVRRLGFDPQRIELTILPGVAETLAVVLTPRAILLADVVTAERVTRLQMGIEDFYRRRTRGAGGAFITRDEIEARNAGRLSDVLRGVPGLRFVRTRTGAGIRFVGSTSQRRDCPPDVWVDGMRASGMEVDDFPVGDIEGVELYHGPSTTPLKFSRGATAGCGTIVLWSRIPGGT